MASESSIYTHAKDLFHSKNAQDAVASGLQLGVAGFNALDALANAKNWQEYAMGQVSAGIGVSKTKSKESSTSNVKPMILTSSEVRNLAPDGHAQMMGVTSNLKQKVIENSGKTADISSPECTYKRETSTVSASVEGGVGAKGVSVSASGSVGGSQAEGRTQDHGTLDTELFIFKAKEGLSASAPVTTDHAILRAKTFNGESKQDFHSGNNWNISANAGFSSSGIASGGFSTSVGEYDHRVVQTNCGIFARQTMDAKFEHMNLKGFALNVDNNAVARPSRDAEGNLEAHPLFEYKIDEDGDCAVSCLDMTRQEAVAQLIKHGTQDPTIRQTLLWDIVEIVNLRIINRCMIPGVSDTPTYWALRDMETQAHKNAADEMNRLNDFYHLVSPNRKSDLKGFYELLGGSGSDLWDLEDLQRIQDTAVKRMQDYLLQPAIFEAFIAHAYGVRYDGLWQHFSFDTIKVLAQINNLHVIIKRLSADGTCYETIREYPAEDAPIIVMLHTMAGTKNGLHPGCD